MPYVKNSNLRSFTFFLLWIARLNSSIEIFSSENMIFFHHLSYRFELELESSLQNEGLRGINIYFDQFYSSRKCIGGKRKKLSIFSSQTDQSTETRPECPTFATDWDFKVLKCFNWLYMKIFRQMICYWYVIKYLDWYVTLVILYPNNPMNHGIFS